MIFVKLSPSTSLKCPVKSAAVKVTTVSSVPVLAIAVTTGASFTADTVHGLPPLTVQFTDNSIGNPTQYQWDFQNDGIIDSYLKNPVFTYTQMGLYSVKLKTLKGFTTDVRIRPNYIKCTYTPQPVLESVEDVTGDQGGKVIVSFLRSYYDDGSRGTNKSEKYFIEINPGAGWSVTDSVDCIGSDQYAVVCNTPFDSTATNNGLINFRVAADMIEGVFTGPEMTGYSVDNLAPQVPQNFEAIIAGQLYSLNWDEVPDADLMNYPIYKTGAGGIFGTIPWMIVNHPPVANLTIGEIPSQFKICAADSSGNLSGFSETIDAPLLMNFALDEGWNDISSWVLPSNVTFENMFAPIANKLVILKHPTGQYYPALHQNTLGWWDSAKGYWMKLSAQASFQIIGFEENNKTIQLNEGWNLIPVLINCSFTTNELAELLGNNLIVIHDGVGLKVFWPSQNISSLDQLIPGNSYMIKMNAPATLTFPECDE